ATDEDWACIARRMAKVPEAYSSYVASLEEGRRRGLHAAPRQVTTAVQQLDEWVQGDPGATWFHEFVGQGPEAQRAEPTAAADAAVTAVRDLRDYLAGSYLPSAEGTPDAVGEERYRLNVRRWMGADIDPQEV